MVDLLNVEFIELFIWHSFWWETDTFSFQFKVLKGVSFFTFASDSQVTDVQNGQTDVVIYRTEGIAELRPNLSNTTEKHKLNCWSWGQKAKF